MKNAFPLLILIFSFWTCEKSFSPLIYNEYIYFTGRADNDLYEFRITNISGEAVWYQGYSKSFPMYQYAIFTNNQWHEKVSGWCGTGLNLYKLNPGDTFLTKISHPDQEYTWRAGIVIYKSPEGEEELKWSPEIR